MVRQPAVATAAMATRAHSETLLEDAGAQHAPGSARRLPYWWLLFLGSFCFVPAVTNSMVLPLLLPPIIERIVCAGSATCPAKGQLLGLLSSVVYGLGLSMPFIGMASDRCSGQLARYGRRRPFIVAGQLTNTTGLVILTFAEQYTPILIGYCLLIAGNILAWVPYQTVLPDIVPAHQRGVAAGCLLRRRPLYSDSGRED